MVKKKLLSEAIEGIASLFKTKGAAEGVAKPEKVFAQNLIDEFGDVEVKEAFRIIDDRTPELEKLFYREGESKMDDLVNLLESRYMSSDRLQAHPLSFKRRGPGAADRYTRIKDTGERLTDMPGGPGDSSLYGKNYGEMSDTVIQGKKVYDTPPSILEEGTRITDEGILIEGKAVQDSLYEKTIADMPLINRMMKQTGKTETEIREAIADLANEGYEAGSPKRMSPFDDDSVRAFVSNRETIPGDKEDFVTEMMERLGQGPGEQIDDLIKGATDETDAILQNMKQMEAETKAMVEIGKAEQAQFGEAIETFNRMIDAGEDPSAALELLRSTLKRTKQAEGGRVGAVKGGIIGLLRRINPRLEKEMVKTGPFQTGHRSDIVGDMEQIKNVSRNEGVSLERLDSLYDMVQDSPRYNEAMKGAMMKLVDYERFRAILLDDNEKLQALIKTQPELGEELIRRLFKAGGSQPQFNLGGLVPPERGPMSQGMGTLYRSK